jgi:hypothetical protein
MVLAMFKEQVIAGSGITEAAPGSCSLHGSLRQQALRRSTNKTGCP